MQAGFIGLGSLGRAMAGHLVETGVKLTVWNRTAGKAADLAAEIAPSPVAVLEASSAVVLCLRDSDAVAEVLESPQGILSGKLDGKLVIDTTTNHYARVLQFHDRIAGHGGRYLEAPVAGSVVPASQGALTVLASGTADALAQGTPLLERIGRRIFHLPEPGQATRMKLINNLVLGNFMAVLAEALAWSEAVGLSRAQALEILAAGAGNSGVLAAKTRKLQDLDFSPHFSAAMIHKDLHYLQDLASDMRRPLWTAALVKELFAQTFGGGWGDEDFSGIYRIFASERDQR
jgi:3-hydroxyisobutyrate dehydrogenase